MNMSRPTAGSLVWHLALRWRAEVDRTVLALGLTHAQYSALASLHAMSQRGEIPTQRELADYTKLQPIFISKLVRSLETAGFISRRADGKDSRAVRLELTSRGLQTAAAARELVQNLDARLVGPIGGNEGPDTVRFKEALRILIDSYDNPGELE